jgi:hypothetical protein
MAAPFASSGPAGAVASHGDEKLRHEDREAGQDARPQALPPER